MLMKIHFTFDVSRLTILTIDYSLFTVLIGTLAY